MISAAVAVCRDNPMSINRFCAGTPTTYKFCYLAIKEHRINPSELQTCRSSQEWNFYAYLDKNPIMKAEYIRTIRAVRNKKVTKQNTTAKSIIPTSSPKKKSKRVTLDEDLAKIDRELEEALEVDW